VAVRARVTSAAKASSAVRCARRAAQAARGGDDLYQASLMRLASELSPAEKQALIEARDAAALGLINRTVPPEQLEAEGLAFARTLASLPPLAVQWTKLSINKTLKLIANAAFVTSLAYEGASMLSQDHLEAVSAFIERRAPTFTGR